MAVKTLLITPRHTSSVYRTMIPALLQVFYHDLSYELDSSLLEKYGACMDYVAEAERSHVMRELLYTIDDAVTGMGVVKIHDIVSIKNVHYRIYWS